MFVPLITPLIAGFEKLKVKISFSELLTFELTVVTILLEYVVICFQPPDIQLAFDTTLNCTVS